MWEGRWCQAAPSPETKSLLQALCPLPRRCCSPHRPAQPQEEHTSKEKERETVTKEAAPPKRWGGNSKIQEESLNPKSVPFVEVGGSCSSLIAIQGGFGNLSTYRRWLLQFTVSFMDTLLFSLDSLLILAKASLTFVWRTSHKAIAIMPFNFHIPSVQRWWDTHGRHDQKQQLSDSERTVLHDQLPCFAAVMCHLNNRDWSILGAWKEPSVCFPEGVALHPSNSRWNSSHRKQLNPRQTVRNKITLNCFLSPCL